MTASPDWDVVRTGLIAWALTRAGLPAGAGQWADDPLVVVSSPEPSLTLQPLGFRGAGTDETVFDDFVPGDTELQPTTGGHRTLALQVAVDSESQLLSESAGIIAERFRTRARAPLALEQLEAMGLGLLSVGEPLTVSVRDGGGRAHARAVVELRLSFVSAEQDEAVGFIESAALTGTATRPDATTISIPVTVSP